MKTPGKCDLKSTPETSFGWASQYALWKLEIRFLQDVSHPRELQRLPSFLRTQWGKGRRRSRGRMDGRNWAFTQQPATNFCWSSPTLLVCMCVRKYLCFTFGTLSWASWGDVKWKERCLCWWPCVTRGLLLCVRAKITSKHTIQGFGKVFDKPRIELPASQPAQALSSALNMQPTA